MARYLKRRKRGLYFVMEIPKECRAAFGGKARFEMTLGTRDERLAEAKAKKLAGEYKLQFLALAGNGDASRALERAEYLRASVEVQEIGRRFGPDDADLAAELKSDMIVDAARPSNDPDDDGPELTALEEARLAGLSDGRSIALGEAPRFKERFEPAFKELADRWLDGWKAAPSRRPSNTAVQYGAAIRLFHEFWGNRTLREVTQRDAAEFVELLKSLPPKYGRGSLAGVPLREAVARHSGEEGVGLSPPSIKRHLGVLRQIWEWAKPLGFCSGEMPFAVKMPKHRASPYLAWETPDLQRLYAAPPKRRDVYEVFTVAMFTGLRVQEIADLTWGRVREEQGVPYFLIDDAKTEAGTRKVPLHSNLRWLLAKDRGGPEEPVFPTFTPEGPRKSRGGDASKLFGAWKRSVGITSRRFVFHSARKNVTRIMEENGVQANVWARVIGHEPGFTYKTYNPTGLTLAKSLQTIELIAYPEVPMRPPAALYGNGQRLTLPRTG